jgi:NTE family protein
MLHLAGLLKERGHKFAIWRGVDLSTMRAFRAPLCCLAVASLAGCASGPTERASIAAALTIIDPTMGYQFDNLKAGPRNTDDVIVVVALSGGGVRAAALGFGALEGLAAIPTQGDATLFDEIDIISGVSGGSILAAATALEGRQVFETFPEKLLYADLEDALISVAVTPSGFSAAFSNFEGRGEVLRRELDRRLFGGATFNDLLKRGTSPYLVISATSIATSTRFDFTKDQFDRLCTRLEDVPLSFAVAASSAVPVVFSPLTIKSNAGSCNAGEQAAGDPLSDGGTNPFVHLIDGALSDNLGLRSILSLAEEEPSPEDVASPPSRIIFISVNAEKLPNDRLGLDGRTPSSIDVAQAIGDSIVRQTNDQTRAALHAQVAAWNAEAAAFGAPPVTLVEVGFEAMSDKALQERLRRIPTRFYLPAADVDELRAVARDQVRAALGGQQPAPAQ